MIRTRLFFQLLCASCALTIAVPAASAPTQSELAAARRLFADALSAEQAGRWADAMDRLKKAIEVKETPGLYYHLGLCHENLKQWVEALVEYERASDLLRTMQAEDVAKLIGPRLAELRKRVSTLKLTAPADAEDLQITVDGQPIRRSLVGESIPLNPGTHEIVATAKGRRTFRQSVQLGEGNAVTEAVDLPIETVPMALGAKSPTMTAPLPVAPAAQAVGGATPTSDVAAERGADDPTKRRSVSPLVYVGFGLGVAGLVVGSVTGIVHLSKIAAVKSDYCNGSAANCKPGFEGPRDAANRFATASEIGFAVGVVGIGVGVVALLTSNRREEHASRGWVMPVVGAGYAGLTGGF